MRSVGRGGRVREGAARARTLDRHLRRQHAGRLFRCDANVSVRRPGEPLGTRCEIKNLNSFRFMQQAIEYEVRRQIELIEDGGTVVQETRLYDPDRGETRADAHARKTRRTTATSPIPTCRRW